MFQWLTNQIRPFTTGHLIEELVPGHGARMARRLQHVDERDKLQHEKKAHELNKAHLEQELEDAEWILDYEKRLAKLQNKTARQRSQAEQSGADTERLRKLEHHLTGLRRTLSLD